MIVSEKFNKSDLNDCTIKFKSTNQISLIVPYIFQSTNQISENHIINRPIKISEMRKKNYTLFISVEQN